MKLALSILAWLGVLWCGVITLLVLGLVVGVGGMVLQEWLREHRRAKAKARTGRERT